MSASLELQRIDAAIWHRIVDTIGPLSPDVDLLLHTMVRTYPEGRTVRQVAQMLGVHPGSLNSRVTRAGLPSLKAFDNELLICYAAALFHPGPGRQRKVVAVTHWINCSSVQSLGRSLRRLTGYWSTEFAARWTFEQALNDLAASLRPDRFRWRMLQPFGADSDTEAAA